MMDDVEAPLTAKHSPTNVLPLNSVGLKAMRKVCRVGQARGPTDGLIKSVLVESEFKPPRPRSLVRTVDGFTADEGAVAMCACAHVRLSRSPRWVSPGRRRPSAGTEDREAAEQALHRYPTCVCDLIRFSDETMYVHVCIYNM